jgi:hypothetical protein
MSSHQINIHKMRLQYRKVLVKFTHAEQLVEKLQAERKKIGAIRLADSTVAQASVIIARMHNLDALIPQALSGLAVANARYVAERAIVAKTLPFLLNERFEIP